jgi:RNA polymerase sigma-70 factor (ECF subfamily)
VIFKKHKKSYSDAEMVSLAQRNSKRFELIYNAYFEVVFRFVFARLGGNEAETADITQMTFVKAMAAIHNYEERGYKLSTWLIRIAQNETNLFFRRQKKKMEIDVSPNQLKELSQETGFSDQEDDLQKLMELINELPQEKQDLLELRFFSGLSFQEIAQLYNITEANAKMRVYRILEKIKDNFKP